MNQIESGLVEVEGRGLLALLGDVDLRRRFQMLFLSAFAGAIGELRRGPFDSYNENPERDPRLNLDTTVWFACFLVSGIALDDMFNFVRPRCEDDDGAYHLGGRAPAASRAEVVSAIADAMGHPDWQSLSTDAKKAALPADATLAESEEAMRELAERIALRKINQARR